MYGITTTPFCTLTLLTGTRLSRPLSVAAPNAPLAMSRSVLSTICPLAASHLEGAVDYSLARCIAVSHAGRTICVGLHTHAR